VAERIRPQFDLQAHRGGAGLRPENTLAAFAHALEIGVTTLECDVHVSLDGVPMVVHDRRLGSDKYCDTAPAVEGDPFFPYVGGLVTDLTVDQLSTLDAGSRLQPGLPAQMLTPGARIPRLSELFSLVVERGAEHTRLNIETKFDALAPHETAPRTRFAEVLATTAEGWGLVDRISIQSFDWECLTLVRQREPRFQLNVLTSPKYLQIGAPGASPWLGGVDIDDFGGDLVAAVVAQGFDAISPIHGSPFTSGVADPAYKPFTTTELVERAHAAGLLVLPYTVDDPATMSALIDAGTDGLITNYPDRLREVMTEHGLA
jgi:glycerophosphoryl diester phosphodiesterase